MISRGEGSRSFDKDKYIKDAEKLSKGYEKVNEQSEADIIILNTA